MPRLPATHRGHRREGTIVVWLALSVAVLIGILALTLDGGRLMEERRHAQAAADAAALAAAGDLYANYAGNQGLDPAGTAALAAVNSATANGYPPGDVTVNVPPRAGAFAGTAGYVEVVIHGQVQAGFSKIFSRTELPVLARAVARGQPMKLGMILLRQSGADAFLNRAAAFTLVNAPLIVDSNDAAALDQASFGVVQAQRFDVTGNYVNPGGALILGTIRTGVPPTPDPLALLPIPDSASATVQSTQPLALSSPVPTVLQPGVYQGGIQASGTAVITMSPGVYIMEGGGFSVGGLASVVGMGVMIYNTVGTSPAGAITIQSQGKVVMTAPTSGVYQGISLFQNRALTQPVAVAGSGLTTLTGVVYAAGAPAQLTGLAAAGLDTLGGAYVVDSMQLSGVGSVNVNLGLTPPRIPDVRLVE